MWRAILGAVGGTSAVMTSYCWNWMMMGSGIMENILPAALSVVFALLTLTAVDMIRLQPADSHTLYTLVKQYIFICRLYVSGKIKMWRFSNYIKNCKKTQSDILRNILSYNKDTEYGLKYKFGTIDSTDEFVKTHPLSTYEDYRSYAERVVNGETNVMTKDPPVFVGLTSGTTGKSKEYPLTERTKTNLEDMFDLAMHQFQPCLSLKRYVQIRILPPKRTTASGLLKTGVTVYCAPPLGWNIIPHQTAQIYKEFPSFYIQALAFLGEKDIGYVECFSSNLAYSFFKLIEVHWRQLCDDISEGTIWSEVDIEDGVRKSLMTSRKPDVLRANKLREELGKGMDGLVKRIWPDIKVIVMGRSAGLFHCANLLESSFLKGVKFGIYMYGATEAWMGINLMNKGYQGETDIYTLLIQLIFFEFIQIDQVKEDQPVTLFAEQLKRGHSYEIVATTYNGLYRYRMGDIIEVIEPGNGDEAPTFVVKYRLGDILNVAVERTPGNIFYKALRSAEGKWRGITIENYTATESFILEKVWGQRNSNKNYFVFLELSGDKRVGPAHAKTLDDTLCQEHEPYERHRIKGSVSQLEIVQVKTGTFAQLKERLMGGRLNSSFKMPRVQRNVSHIKFLLEEAIAE